jgi:hypothetical protein
MRRILSAEYQLASIITQGWMGVKAKLGEKFKQREGRMFERRNARPA